MLSLAAQKQLPDPKPTEATENGLATGSRAPAAMLWSGYCIFKILPSALQVDCQKPSAATQYSGILIFFFPEHLNGIAPISSIEI